MTSSRIPACKPALIAAVIGLTLTASAWSFGLMASVAAQGGEYELALSSVVIASGDTNDVLLTATPGNATPAAIGGEITYDETLLSATACEPLVDVSDCNIATPGVVLFQALDPNGWSAATDLISVTFENIALEGGETSMDIVVEQSVDTNAAPITPDIVPGAVSTITHGDVNCDNNVDIVDALFIAQFGVGNRTAATTCPLDDPVTQLLESTVDVNCDDASNIVDALLIAQYSVGNRVAETTCPLSDPATTIYLGS